MATQPANLKHARPESGLRGWAAAWAVLDRIDNDRQREALAHLVRNLGVQGAPCMDYAAKLARWLAGTSKDAPTPKAAVKRHEYAFVERRVREELAKLDGKLFPRMRKLS